MSQQENEWFTVRFSLGIHVLENYDFFLILHVPMPFHFSFDKHNLKQPVCQHDQVNLS